LVLDCLTTNDRPGCNPQGGRVLGAQKDFQDQKGRLQEEVENLAHRVLFLPISLRTQFHRTPARENCENRFQTIVPVSNPSMGSTRAIDAYSVKIKYGTEESNRLYIDRIGSGPGPGQIQVTKNTKNTAIFPYLAPNLVTGRI